MKFLKKLSTVTAIAMLSVASTAQAGVVIDLFNDPVAAGGQSVSSTLASGAQFLELDGLNNVIGGSRDIYAQTTAASFGAGATTLTVGGGFMSYSQSSGVTGRGVIQWDGDDNSAALNGTGLNNANLTSCGSLACDRITATVLQADFGFGYSITMVDMDGDVSVLTSSTQFPVASPTSADYLFTWFNLAGGTYFDGGLLFDITRSGTGDGTIDFSKIGALQFEINVPFGTIGTQADIDLTLSAITTNIPEPGTLALVGGSLLGLALAGRRRQVLKA